MYINQKSIGFLRQLFLITILIQLSTFNTATGQTKTDQIDKLLSKYNEYEQFNGSVLIAEKGEVIYKKGFGLANMEWNIPNKPDTKHRLGSITKQFTAVLILQLVEQGKLTLDVPISTYLPDYSESGKKITIHHLLTHTAGIPNYSSFSGFFNEYSRDPYTPEEFVTVFADSTLQFVPGQKFAYSNSGYFLLGMIIEKMTGKSYEEALQEYIFEPLKMTNTGFDHHSTILKNRASGYRKDGKAYINAPYLDMSIPYAAGSLYATVEDLYLWDQALYTDKLLSKKYKDLMFTKHIPTNGGHYGYGWGIGKMPIGNTKDSLDVIEHGGGIHGFNTLITRIPSDKNLIVLFSNVNGPDLNEITIAINGILNNKLYDMPQKSLAEAFLYDIQELGIANAKIKFNENKKSEIYALNEREMNRAGYHMLQQEKIKEAIEIFKINVDAFPESSNVYDSLGEAYLKDDNRELAIKNYKKSIELNPKNTHGISVLEKLQSKE